MKTFLQGNLFYYKFSLLQLFNLFTESLQFRGLQAGSQVTELSEINDQRIDCNVSEWSIWSPCEGCRGFTISRRNIIVIIYRYEIIL